MKKYIILCSIIFIITGCKSHQSDCINDFNKEIKLRWGYFITQSGMMKGFQLNNDATLCKIDKPPNSENFIETKLLKIDGEQYCRVLYMTRDTILKIQALREPGDSLHFIEYFDSRGNVRIMALWNPINKTYGSSGFREIFDSLQALIPVVH